MILAVKEKKKAASFNSQFDVPFKRDLSVRCQAGKGFSNSSQIRLGIPNATRQPVLHFTVLK